MEPKPFKPHKYQERAIEFVIQQACAGLLLDPGLGKTAIMMAAFKILKTQGLVKRMLVVTPLRPMFQTWPAEGRKWREFNDLRIGVLHGPTKGSILCDEEIDIHIINPEGLKWLFKVVDEPQETWDVLCIDESTRFKHTDTERFRIIRPNLEKFGRRYILTGSPAPNGLMDLFGQVFCLDLGASLGQYITHYRSRYFHQSYDGFGWEPNWGAEEKIYEKLAPLCLRMSAEEYLKLPPLVGAAWSPEGPLIRQVELPAAARKVYDRMEASMIAVIESDEVTAINAAAVTNKCRQIANGGVYGSATRKDFGDTRGMYDIHDAKTDAVEEIVEELQGTPALVAYDTQHDLDRLQRRFPKAPRIGSGVSAGAFTAIERDWNAGKISVLLAQPQSVAHGLNLQGTKGAVIWHSLTWDLEVYEQFIKRVHRQGQQEKVFVHHIIAKDTIDEVLMDAIKSKDKTQRALLKALRERYT